MISDPHTPETIVPYLRNLTADDLRPLYALIDELERETNYGKHKFQQFGDNTLYQGFVKSPLISQLIKMCYNLNLVINFPECPTWTEGSRYLDAGCPDIERKDLVEVVKLLTYAIRQDKYSEGSLAVHCSNGAMSNVLNRLKFLLHHSQGQVRSK